MYRKSEDEFHAVKIFTILHNFFLVQIKSLL